jgi:5-methylthioadenosine/S-adenosylhomocysteine deaminase
VKGYLIEQVMMIPMDGENAWTTGDIAVVGDRIRETGVALGAKYPDLERVSGKDRLALPGLVNCHTHCAMTLLRGYGDDLPLMEWLETKVFPREAHLTGEDVYWASLLAMLEMIKGGVTAFADMYYFMEETARAAEESGMRAALCRGLVSTDGGGVQRLEENLELARQWHGKADGRITVMLGPHAPYTTTLDYLREVMAAADENGLGLHMHLSETQAEVGQVREKYGMGSVELMESIGLFEGRRVLAAHCVAISPEERDILVKRGVGVAHNPQSNLKLASGVAPVPELLAAGGLVGLGTDGASSNNDLDMFEEIRACAMIHKGVRLDSTLLPASQVLDMATRQGARVLGLDHVGSIQAGYKADLILLDLRKPHLTPMYDPISHCVYAVHAQDVDTVWADGKMLMKGRTALTLDEERILFEARRCGEDLVRR